MQVTPLHNKILVRVPSSQERKAGKIIIPSTVTSTDNNYINGIVIAVGKGRLTSTKRLPPPNVKPGDKVLLGRFAGTRFMVDGALYMIIYANEVLCVFEEDE